MCFKIPSKRFSQHHPVPSLCAATSTPPLAWQTLTLLVLISLTIYINFLFISTCLLPERGSCHLINACQAYKPLRIITQLTFYYGPFELNLIKRLPGKHTLSPGVWDHWITLNIYDLLCLIYCCIAWRAKRQLFQIITGRSFCDRRKRVSYSVDIYEDIWHLNHQASQQ